MNFNLFNLHANRLLLELEEGLSFHEAAVSFHLNETADTSPSLQDSNIKEFLRPFRDFDGSIGVEVDRPVAMLKELPAVFFFTVFGESLGKFVDEMNKHLDSPYRPSDEFRTLGFFPSRPGKPVVEINQQGEVFSNGQKIAQEFIVNPPEWALNLITEAQQHSDIRYNHHKISSTGKRKVYGYTFSIHK